jgi:hypothetical protein
LPWVFGEFFKKKVYLKHFNSIDYALIDDYTFKSIEIYKSKGALSKKDLLSKRIEEDLWSEQKDKELKSFENNIQLMLSKRSNAVLESQIDQIDSLIQDYESKYYSLLNKKESLLKLSAESLSNSPTSEFILYSTFYEDENLQKKCFDLDDVINFDDDQLIETIDCYKNTVALFGLNNIRKLSVNRRISDSVKNSVNAESFFGRHGYLLTQNQVTLFENCKYFSSLFEKITDITDEERQDPNEVEKIFIAQMNSKKEKRESKADDFRNAANAFKSS